MIPDTVWAEVSCDVPVDVVDSVAEFLIQLSGNGVSIENLTVDTFSVENLEESTVKTIKAYLPDNVDLTKMVDNLIEFLAGVSVSFPGYVFPPPHVKYIREEDWANNWKEHFKPSRIGTRLVIKPTWEEYSEREDDVVIELDPGMAFGTGTHATTRLCLESLERIFLGEPPFDRFRQTIPSDILDVGTGSGVLGIAAAKLGAGRVTGIDIDPGAVEVAHQNLIQNHVENTVRVTTEPLENVADDYDVVLANILAEELVRLGTHLFSKVRKKGLLILSGILAEKEDLVRSGFSSYPLNLMEITREAEWSCIVYRREE